ncbi:MAG: type II secretion system secretin GspD [Thermodesulfovibrionales bacterium]|nr:type II secretion system secretin GspD [Thermodesulfovibrionales bacterium]
MNKRIITFLSIISLILLIICSPCLASKLEIPTEQKVAFNFVDVDLPVITKFISEVTKKNFVYDERLKGKVTIITPAKINVDDAFNLYTSVLELKGFSLVPTGSDIYKIIPLSEAKQKSIAITKDKQPINESFIVRLISLTNISSEDALKLIQPLISKEGHASSFGPGNLLLIIDSGLNIEKIMAILNDIDQSIVKESPEIVFLQYSSADSIAKIINEGLKKTRPTVQPLSIDEPRAVADQRLNAVVLFGDRGSRQSMKSLISLLDVKSSDTLGRINIYFLENADATELQKVLDNILKGSHQQRQQPTTAIPVIPFESVSGISITADKASNSLIIVASPADYHNISQIIKKLDRKPRQVYVEAMIVEASIDNLRDLGAKWRATAKHKGEPVFIGGFGSISSSSILNIIQGLEGVSFGGLGNFIRDIPVTSVDDRGNAITNNITIPGFAALFNLNEFKDAINILSIPQILTSDNKEAEIVVGENVPFISKRERDLTTTNTVLSSIERKDVGITLKITPQITEGDYVKLDIYQEISSLKQSTENILINVGPTTTKRSTKTSVVVKDGQTVVIGGLMQEREEINTNKLPLLGDIPLLGMLFKNESISKKKTNLLVFLTPHIVKESDKIAQITENKKKEFAMAENSFAEDELLIKFKESITEEEAQKIIESQGATIIKFIEGVKIYHIKLSSKNAKKALQHFSQLPEVKYAEPNYIIKLK